MERVMRRGVIPAIMIGFLLVGPIGAEEKDPLREQALKLNEITGTATMEGELKALIKDEEGTKKLLDVAIKMTKEKPQPFNYTAAFILARSAQALKNFEVSETFYKLAAKDALKLESANKILLIYDSLIDLYYANKKFDEAIKTCKELLDIENHDNSNPINRVKPFVMERMIQSMARKGMTAEALKLTERLIEDDGDGWYFVRLKAEVLREAGNLEEAAKTYEETLSRLKKLKDLEEDRRERFSRSIRYSLSGVYVDLNKIDSAAEQLQLLLKKNPENPTFMNDLGFIWADHDMNLDESEKLIRKAIEEERKLRKKLDDLTPDEDKDNPAYLDSLGWVLFKKKDYQGAKKYLQEAITQKDGQHIEILDHLADVQQALGEKAEAIKTWEKALKMESATKRDKERRTMIETKLKKVQGPK